MRYLWSDGSQVGRRTQTAERMPFKMEKQAQARDNETAVNWCANNLVNIQLI